MVFFCVILVDNVGPHVRNMLYPLLVLAANDFNPVDHTPLAHAGLRRDSSKHEEHTAPRINKNTKLAHRHPRVCMTQRLVVSVAF